MVRHRKKIAGLLALVFSLCLLFPFASCDAGGKEEEFSVLTWNVFLGNGDGDSFATVLEENLPDVLQMQEASPQAYTKFIQPFVSAHSEYFVSDIPLEGETLRTPILFNTEKFDYIDGGAELLTDGFKPTNTKTLSWLLLESKGCGKLLCVNFHGVKCLTKYEGYQDLTQEERDAVEEEWHLGNARQLLEKIDQVKKEYGTQIKTVISGDCNFDSTSGAYAAIVEAGYRDAEKSAEENMQDGLRTSHSLGVEKSKAGLSIDHVFSDAALYQHRIIRTREAYFASDHCPVYVTFGL